MFTLFASLVVFIVLLMLKDCRKQKDTTIAKIIRIVFAVILVFSIVCQIISLGSLIKGTEIVYSEDITIYFNEDLNEYYYTEITFFNPIAKKIIINEDNVKTLVNAYDNYTNIKNKIKDN